MVSAHKRHDSFALICVHLRLKPFLVKAIRREERKHLGGGAEVFAE